MFIKVFHLHMTQDFPADFEYYFIKYTYMLRDCCICFGRRCFGSNYGMIVIMATMALCTDGRK